jgi:hypothetical protein
MILISYLMPFRQVPQINLSARIDENTLIFDALGRVLLDAQEFHQKSFPMAKSIQRCVQ